MSTTQRVADMIVNAIDGAEVLNPDVAAVSATRWTSAEYARVTIILADGTAWVADIQRARGLDHNKENQS